MKKNPCRNCALSVEFCSRHAPSYEKECGECELLQKHKEYLKSQRKFIEGEQITSIDELMRQEWVIYCHTATKHIEVIKHFQLSTVLAMLEHGQLQKAVRK